MTTPRALICQALFPSISTFETPPLSYTKSSSNVTTFEVLSLAPLLDTTNNVDFPLGSYNLEFTDPVTTTTYESSYTNDTSVTVEESVGFSADGPSVTAGGSVT